MFAKNPAALELITNLLAEPQPELSVPVVSQTGSPPGTYWMLKGAPVPWPVNPYPDLPVYAIGTNNNWSIDNRSVDYKALSLLAQAEAQLTGLTNGTLTTCTFDINSLWIEVPTDSLATPGYLTVNVMDMFDCVLPTRVARNGTAYTRKGAIGIKGGAYTRRIFARLRKAATVSPAAISRARICGIC